MVGNATALTPSTTTPLIMEEEMTIWSIYLLRDETNSLYTGITTDVNRRVSQHRSSGRQGAKYSRLRKRFDLVYSCQLGNRSLASRVEYRIKRLAKSEKERVVFASFDREQLLRFLGLYDDAPKVKNGG